MLVKLFEVRDRATFIACIGIRLSTFTEVNRWLVARAGYGMTFDEQASYVLFGRLDGDHGAFSSDPQRHMDRPGRTMRAAHQHVIDNWDALDSGAVIDVEHILGETAEPKPSERMTPREDCG